MATPIFEPKLLTVLRAGYSGKQFSADLVSGIVVGVIALPLAIAFGIASGVKPEQGLFTAIVAGILVSALGGSRVQIAGPTGAFIVIVYGIVQRYGYEGLAIATLMAGVLMVGMGLARLGTLLRFVPYPLTVGFTSGIALVIFSTQVKDLFGLDIPSVSPDFIEKWRQFAKAAMTADWPSAAVGLGSLVLLALWPRRFSRVPGTLVVLVAATAAVHLLDLPVDTIGNRFGEVPSMLPSPKLPAVSWQTVTGLVSPAFTIAVLGAIESLLSAVVADGMLRTRHRSNTELIAQGIANIASPLFGGIPATGAIARTAANVKNGGRTPVAGIVHGVTLFVVVLLFARWAALIPMPVLAAILTVVAYNMSEWHSFVRLLKSPRSDVAVMVVTFLLTVLVDLTVALQIGVIMSAMLFIRRMAEVSQVNPLTRDLRQEEEEGGELEAGPSVPDGVEVFEVRGTLFFGAVDQFSETLRQIERAPRAVVLELSNLLAIDASGLRMLELLADDLRQRGAGLILAGLHKQPLVAISQSGLVDRIGEDNLCGTLEEALLRAASMPAAGGRR